MSICGLKRNLSLPMHCFNSNGKKILHFHVEENKWRFKLLFCFVINIFQSACRNIQEPSPLKCWNVIAVTFRRVSAFTTITLTESSTLEWRQGVGRLRRCVTLGCIEYDLPPPSTTTTWLWLDLSFRWVRSWTSPQRGWSFSFSWPTSSSPRSPAYPGSGSSSGTLTTVGFVHQYAYQDAIKSQFDALVKF